MCNTDTIWATQAPTQEHSCGYRNQLYQSTHCQKDISLLIFGDYARDAAGLEAYARLMAELIQQTALPAYVIAPPSDPGDLDSPALLLKVSPVQEEPGFTTPDEWEQLIGRLSDEHCQQE